METRLPASSGYSPFRRLGKSKYARQLSITSSSLIHVKTCGVYYLTDGLDVLYVGASTNVEARVKAHARGDIDFSQVFVDRCEPKDLRELECEAIKRYRPPFNEVGRGGIPCRALPGFPLHISYPEKFNTNVL